MAQKKVQLASTEFDLASYRNAVINGNMQVNQWTGLVTQTGITGANTSAWLCDRWYLATNTNGTWNLAGSVPIGGTLPGGITHTSGASCTVGDVPTGSDYTVFQTVIEGNVWRGFVNRPLVLSFWVNSNVTGLHTVVLTDNVSQSFVATYTINVANAWEFKTVNIPVSAIAWGAGLGQGVPGVYLQFGLAYGPNYVTATPNQWVANAGVRTVAGIANTAVAGGQLYLTGVQIEVGTTFTTTEHVPYEVEIRRCERYMERVDGIVRFPAYMIHTGGAITNISETFDIPYRVRKCKVPTGIGFSPGFQMTIVFENSINYGGASALIVYPSIQVTSYAPSSILINSFRLLCTNNGLNYPTGKLSVHSINAGALYIYAEI